MSRFTDMMGIAPPIDAPTPPNAVRVAAAGAAMPAGFHRLSNEQQRAWFGGAVFVEPVEFKAGVFRSGDMELTPRQVVARARESR